MQSATQVLYSRLVTKKDLSTLVDQPEDLHLEAKPGHFPITEDLQGCLSQALSGFANSDGGVLIFGMTTRRNSNEEPDVITRLEPFENPVGLVSEVNRLLGQAVVPLVEGVQVGAISTEKESNYGYVKVLVPASDSGPHRAMLKKAAREYWKRSGDSFYKMEHFDIADMFARRRRPKLELTRRLDISGLQKPPTGPWACRLDMIFGFKNMGRSIANFPYIEIRHSDGCRLAEFGLDGNRGSGLPRVLNSVSNRVAFAGGAGDVIHVGTIREINRLTLAELRSDIPRGVGWNFEFAVSAEDHPLEVHRVEITMAELQEHLRAKDLLYVY